MKKNQENKKVPFPLALGIRVPFSLFSFQGLFPQALLYYIQYLQTVIQCYYFLNYLLFFYYFFYILRYSLCNCVLLGSAICSGSVNYYIFTYVQREVSLRFIYGGEHFSRPIGITLWLKFCVVKQPINDGYATKPPPASQASSFQMT